MQRVRSSRKKERRIFYLLKLRLPYRRKDEYSKECADEGSVGKDGELSHKNIDSDKCR